MNQKLSDWVNFAQILGAVAIVISLAVVAPQIHENTRATQAASYQQQLGFEIELLTAVGSDSSSSRVYLASPDDERFAALDPQERSQARWLLPATYRLWEGFYLQHLDGTMSERAWAARETIVREFAQGSAACSYVNRARLTGA